MTTYDLRPAAGRAVTRAEWRETWHSFAFGDHYDPANTSFGALLASNDDTLAPGTGYLAHRHAETEIVSWVLEGELTHEDSAGRSTVVRPGFVQWLSAGSGAEHSERNAGPVPVRFVQMWLRPVEAGGEPGYVLRDVSGALSSGALVPVLEVGAAVLHVGRLLGGLSGELAAAPYVHLYVARGAVTVDAAGELGEGDALRVTGCEGGHVVAGEQGAELLVWAMSDR